MDASPTLLARVGRLLRAKQYLVFYAIGLYVLTFVPPLVTGWLREHHPLTDVIRLSDAPFADVWVSPTAAVIAVIVAVLLLDAWFTAGYLRSLIGRLHWGPVDGRQFRRLVALGLLLQLLSWGFSAAGTALGLTADAQFDARLQLVALGLTAVAIVANLLVLYADYAIVASNVSLPTAIGYSLRTVNANRGLSVLTCISFAVVAQIQGVALGALSGAAGQVVPWLVIAIVLTGSLFFVYDVLLLTVYIDSVERGKVTREQQTLP